MLPYELGHCSNTLGGYNYLPNPGLTCHSLNYLFVLCRWSATLKALLFSLCNKAQTLSFVMPQSTFMSTVHMSTMCTIKHQPEHSFSTCLPRKSCFLPCHCPPAWWERINKSRNSQTSEEKLLEWQRRAGRQQTTPFQENTRLCWKSLSQRLSAGIGQEGRQWWISCCKSTAWGCGGGTPVVRFTVPRHCRVTQSHYSTRSSGGLQLPGGRGCWFREKLLCRDVSAERAPARLAREDGHAGEMKSTALSLFVPDLHLWENHQCRTWKKLQRGILVTCHWSYWK